MPFSIFFQQVSNLFLFRLKQHHASIKLTSKCEIKSPGGPSPTNSNLLLFPQLFLLPLGLSSFSFSIANESTSFIYLFGQLYFPLKHDSKPSHKFFCAYHETPQDFARIHPNLPSHFSKISSSTQRFGLLLSPQNSRPSSKGTFTTRSGH